MQDLIKRHFWVIGALVAAVCAVFAAKAAGHLIEGMVLGDAEHSAKITPQSTTTMSAPVAKVLHTKDGTTLVSRDIFCSECKPVVDTSPKAGSGDNSNVVINTTLPLQLLATNVGAREIDSFASIVSTENQIQGAFGIGDKVPGATGGVVAVHYKFIDFENNGHIERLGLQGAPPPPVAVAEVTPPPSDGSGDPFQEAIDNGVKKIDDTTFEIDRSLVDKIRENPMGVKGARIVPNVKNGKAEGFKLYAIKSNSVYAKLGLINGDAIDSINGYSLNTAQDGLTIYTKLQDATSLQMDITRRGKSMTMKYTIH